MKYITNNTIRSKKIDRVLNDIYEREPVELLSSTPSILVKYGIKNLPIYENPSHIRKNILTSFEAYKLGLRINSNDHYHGLGKEIFLKALDSLNDPKAILKNIKVPDEYLILTTILDSDNNVIIIPIEVETSTVVNKIKIEINRVKTVYGYSRKNPSLEKYIKDNINLNKMEIIYEKKNEVRV